MRFFPPRGAWAAALTAIVLLAAALRLHGIHIPMLDHPGWRQGDTAAIARNFARLNLNVMYPQTMYDGPPPNYVELELQIVPFLAALLYKLFGIHEVFGRLISLTFSLATVVVAGAFARWLFRSALAGLAAAFFYAVFPGSVYYGRTFMPDAAMVFFLTAALYVVTRLLVDDERLRPSSVAWATALLTTAYLAKPVAALAVVPLAAVVVERARARGGIRALPVALLLAVPLVLLWLYDRGVRSHAEWHWASGITQLHVLPALRASLLGAAAFGAKFAQFGAALGMLRATMLGPLPFWLSLASLAALPWLPTRSRALLWGWLAGGLIYAFVVVTVERVDYYLYPVLPLCALLIGGALARFVAAVRGTEAAPATRYALLAVVPALAIAALLQSRAPVAPYYRFDANVYRDAVALDRALPAGTLVVIGHYGPNVQYYVDRFGWEEDPALWTPFDEESAIRKGARYFIAIEDRRLRANADLCVWMLRFPMRADLGRWPVYETDPHGASTAGELLWRAYRRAEREGTARAFLRRVPSCASGADTS